MRKIIGTSKKHGAKEILVDDEDFDYLNSFNWNIVKQSTSRTFYAKRSVTVYKPRKRTYCVFMHRQILKIRSKKIFTDHIDHNGLNNQKKNIRRCTKNQNNCNRGKNTKSSSKYLGVCLYSRNGKWNAYAHKKINGRTVSFNLGYFNTEKEAAKVRDAKVKELFGEFANLNFK